MVLLIPASIPELRANWQFFVTGVGEVIDKCNADFHPADVYRELTTGGVHLYWVEVPEGDCVGFTVLSDYTDRYSQKRVLNMDMTYLIPLSDVLLELRDAVDALASELEYDRIEWFSPRLGWDRQMEKIGFRSDSKLFVREVQHG